MKSSTCSDHAVQSSELSDASGIIVPQVVGMGKGEPVWIFVAERRVKINPKVSRRKPVLDRQSVA